MFRSLLFSNNLNADLDSTPVEIDSEIRKDFTNNCNEICRDLRLLEIWIKMELREIINMQCCPYIQTFIIFCSFTVIT